MLLKWCEDTDGGGVDWGDWVEDPLDEGKCDDSEGEDDDSPGDTGWYGGGEVHSPGETGRYGSGEVHCEDGSDEGDAAVIALGEADEDVLREEWINDPTVSDESLENSEDK